MFDVSPSDLDALSVALLFMFIVPSVLTQYNSMVMFNVPSVLTLYNSMRCKGEQCDTYTMLTKLPPSQQLTLCPWENNSLSPALKLSSNFPSTKLAAPPEVRIMGTSHSYESAVQLQCEIETLALYFFKSGKLTMTRWKSDIVLIQ